MAEPAPEITVLDALVAALREAGQHNSHDDAARVAVLWTDPDQQWTALIPALRERLPVLTLDPAGKYDPETLTGPAYYLRCLVSRTLPGVPVGEIPVVYLPGVSRAAVRVREECPKTVLPLVELQYRGAFFDHNYTDWTISAFLQAALSVAVAPNGATREAAQRAVARLAAEPVERLRKDAPLRADWFDRLHHPDPARELLNWLSNPTGFKSACGEERWAAFRSLVRTAYDLDVETDGPVTAARNLGERTGPWKGVWERFEQVPDVWPGVASQLRQARPTTGLFDRVRTPERWPQDNEEAEGQLRAALGALTVEKPGAAREAVVKLEAEHGGRRATVWAKLDQAPLAKALAHLAIVARGTQKTLAGSIGEIATAWAADGWRTDLAVLDARAVIDAPADEVAVRSALRAMYFPWLDASAAAFQKAVAAEGWARPKPVEWGVGTCVLFSDGLRFDVAQRLAEMLTADGLAVSVDTRRGALPGVTETGKPALMPIADKLKPASGFDVSVTGSTSPTASASALRGLLEKAGIDVVAATELGDTNKRGWTECGEIDHRGHDAKWELGCEMDGLLRKIAHRIRALIDAGWAEVRVVTDHGWLVLPGDLPKPVDGLPEHLTAVRKGRCARVKPNSQTNEQTVPWHFDEGVRVAVAAGASCYEAGKGYEHGGLSPQECVLPVLSVRRGVHKAGLAITKIKWKGLRVSVEVEGAPEGATVDVRQQPGDADGWLGGKQPIAPDGHATGLVKDDKRLETAAFVVVLSPAGAVLAQKETTVGAR